MSVNKSINTRPVTNTLTNFVHTYSHVHESMLSTKQRIPLPHPPTPPPKKKKKKKKESKKRRYEYNQTDIICAHSHCTVRLAVTLTSWVPMPLRAVQTYTPLSSHLAITLYVRGDNSLCTSVPLARLTSLTVGVGRPSPAVQSNVTLWVSCTTSLPWLPFSVIETWLGGSEM